jgi:hypothetical protein
MNKRNKWIGQKPALLSAGFVFGWQIYCAAKTHLRGARLNARPQQPLGNDVCLPPDEQALP